MVRFLARKLLRLFGWKVDYALPEIDKYVLVGAPHTSNWDFPLAILFFLTTGLRFNWVGKHSMFRWPVAGLFKSIGGMPINRSASAGFIDQTALLFKESSSTIVTIAPEGTRAKTQYWRTGFYYIALQADVPIALGYINYATKELGIGPLFQATGDIEKDFQFLREFYQGITGKRPQMQGPVTFRKKTLN